MHDNILPGDSGDEGKFLYALKATQPGDRQLVWEGGSERGVVAVVDFAAPVGVCAYGIYYAWGATTMLKHPVDHTALRAVPLLNARFFGEGRHFLHGRAKRLAPDIGLARDIAKAIDRLAGGLPPQQTPSGDPTDAPTDRWFGSLEIEPECVFELAVLATPKLWSDIGFPSAPIPQVQISPRDRPDLLADGVVGEVKRIIAPKDIKQVERYLNELERSRARVDGWRAVLIHAGTLSPAVRASADESTRSRQIEIWRLEEGIFCPFEAVLQRPAPPA
jgi:hypothetical protein